MKATTSLFPRLVLLAALSLGTAAFGAETAKPDPYTQAVAAYIEAASRQISAVRGEIDLEVKHASDGAKKKYAEAYQELTRCDKLIARLKASDPSNFDQRKARFEGARNEMVGALEAARRTP